MHAQSVGPAIYLIRMTLTSRQGILNRQRFNLLEDLQGDAFIYCYSQTKDEVIKCRCVCIHVRNIML